MGDPILVSPMRKVMIPRQCPRVAAQGSEGDRCPLDSNYIVANLCSYVDQQTVKLQEIPEDVPTGEMPRHISCVLERNLVDRAIPGTRCTIVGFIDTFDQTKQRMVDTVALKVNYIRVLGIESESSGIGRALSTFSPSEEEFFIQLAHSPNVYERIVENIAPSIHGEYTVDIKKAIACQLFSGSRKQLPDRTHIRGDINILLMGDPSTAKSQFLKFVEKVAPVGVYTSGKGSSAAGLTASVVQDARGDFYLEGGAMVLADGGIVCIDEFDKMHENDRVAIHEAMEQQTISIAKAGITTVLNSRCSVLAAANPVYGRYDDTRSTMENMDFLPSILSRFDLIFIVRDIRDFNRDLEMAKNVMNVHVQSGKVDQSAGEIPLDVMKRFIAYCRAKCSPRLSEDACMVLENNYIAMRDEIRKQSAIDGSNPPVPISVRQLEAVVRIAESLAKMRLAPEATVDDANEALRLFKVSTMSAARSGVVTSDVLPPEIKRQVDLIETMIKSRVAIGSQIARSRVVNSDDRQGYSPFSIERALSALTRRKDFDEKNQGRMLVRLR
ncbi:uncharacterized protein [Blastocystis hominis]|uniref:DNA replication licensing factor MCM5 n=1 Tax=Blastocystis hominis TaxID=12968 RepID=D8LV30_BLAHO|nr:uncharacterized protein [Blastocystis hominis]CBK19669.2 unnamed protein product [Blastocystis hominis]|eukprot:XP_012893717.1 uncharacterized protein [Blastocystis hominis]